MFKPLNEYVLVKLDDQKLESSCGILLDQTSLPKATTGTVFMVAKNRTGITSGDKILMHPYTGDLVTFEGVQYKIIKAEDVLGSVHKHED